MDNFPIDSFLTVGKVFGAKSKPLKILPIMRRRNTFANFLIASFLTVGKVFGAKFYHLKIPPSMRRRRFQE